MNKVKILIQGYAKKSDNGWIASSTVTLVQSNGKNIVVDPGCNRQKLIESLGRNKLQTSDIDYVLLTHSHTDHILLDGIFENAKVITSVEIYDNDYQIDHRGKIYELNLEIIKTPGHSVDSRSFVVETDKGIYVIAGDVFWWMDDEEQITDQKNLLEHDDLYVKDKEALIKSRKKILDVADFIIPGHGKMFRNQ